MLGKLGKQQTLNSKPVMNHEYLSDENQAICV